MAQLRQDYAKFVEHGAAIVVVGPDNRNAFKRYWADEQLPFIGLADPDHTVANQYGQQIKILKFGRMPALMLIDQQGFIRFEHYANSMRDIVPNQTVLNMLTTLNQTATP